MPRNSLRCVFVLIYFFLILYHYLFMYWLIYLFYYFSIFKRSVSLIKWPCLGVGSLCSVIHRENSGPLQSVLYWSIIRKKNKEQKQGVNGGLLVQSFSWFFFFFFSGRARQKGNRQSSICRSPYKQKLCTTASHLRRLQNSKFPWVI